METRFQLVYPSVADLRAHLVDHASQGAFLVEHRGDLGGLKQYDSVTLDVRAGETRCQIQAEVLQVLPGTGVAVQLIDLGDAALLAASVSAAEVPMPTVEVAALVSRSAREAQEEGRPSPRSDASAASSPATSPRSGLEGKSEDDPRRASGEDDAPRAPLGAGVPRGPKGSSPISWSNEHLRAEWDSLTVADRVRVARYGGRPARMLVLRGTDKSLHIHVLQNPNVTVDEVAFMAGMASLDAAVLRRIATRLEWQKNPGVARALVTNPKLPLPLLGRLLGHVPRDELSRLARTGKLRASAKRAIVQYLDRHR